jgi:LPXTG-motif cell wall-anchored protein
MTIHVGDTVTWTNNGPSPHNATANNGSFNTGNLNKGQSASHTFTQAGTFAYICTIHPFMHGTVVVLASVTTTTPTTTTPTAGTATTATTATSSSGLPNTGLNLLGGVIAGAGMIGVGVVLRRRSHSRADAEQ